MGKSESNNSFREKIKKSPSKIHLTEFAGVINDEEAKKVKERINRFRNTSYKK